ncbi:MAG TPA: diaminopimelate decarboxylase [bacterium]|nr:diaminopimelate decarboxylase [bacterium]HPO51534.1 diaminopimelate decarboxylase [bacterium]HXK44308.1 diaminopimelate decarboxylase [bacterium]
MERYLEMISNGLYRFVDGKLMIEGVDAEEICEKFGTPLYVYSANHIKTQINKLREAFHKSKPLICYSMKANGSMKILGLIKNQGCGLDIVSQGELFKAIKQGFSPKKIVFAGVGKTEQEIVAGLKTGIYLFTVESVEELKMIDRIAGKLKKIANVSLRINLDVDVDTHHYTKTGRKETKFGMPENQVASILTARNNLRYIKIKGIQFHLGSNIKSSAPYLNALNKLKNFLKEVNFCPSVIDIGGGFGISYRNEEIEPIEHFGSKIADYFIKNFSGVSMIIEPGRFIVGNAGILLTRVIYKKQTNAKNFLIVDAGMNDLIRPALYDSYHEILPVSKKEGRYLSFDVVGPVCETGDFLGKERKFTESIGSSDILAVMGAGAYGFSMSSNYNGRLRASEVMISGKTIVCCRKREKMSDLWKNECW